MRDSVVFYLNHQRHEVRGAQLAVSLSEYLRGLEATTPHERLTGTKIVCAEGDCGACSILVGRPAGDGKSFEYAAIDSCIAFVFQMHRAHVVTIEGLAPLGELTPVQAAMVNCHGSQCGFCTPGFVMTLHGMIEQHAGGGSAPLDEEQLRQGLSGNLCRCTGYLQILEAARAYDVAAVPRIASCFDTQAMLADLEQLGDPVIASLAGGHISETDRPNGRGHRPGPQVGLPRTLQDLVRLRREWPDATLVCGATDLGVRYNHGTFRPADVIYTGGVAELQQIDRVADTLLIGAAVSWQRIAEFTVDHAPAYSQLLRRFGSPQIRTMGTLGGNLVNASPIADSIPFHFVCGATLTVASEHGDRDIAIEDFYLGYKKIDLQPNEVLVRVRTPLPRPAERLQLYKVSRRRDMDISTVTAAFLLTIESASIVSARVALGGVGPVVMRVPQTETFLAGKDFTLTAMKQAGQIARDEVTPISDVRGSDKFRQQLVENLFLKCYYDIAQPSAATTVGA